MTEIRKYLINDTELFNLVGSNIFLLEKPFEVETEEYLIYKYKISDGRHVKRYQLEFNIVGKDLNKLLLIQNRLIALLDDYKNETRIKNIKHISLLNGGGMIKNPDSGNFEIILYFLVQK